MGDVVSTTGFYNDRKIIRYADGTVEYPTLEAIPFHQTEERIQAYRRLLQELERTGKPNHVPLHLRPILPEDSKDRSDEEAEEDSDSHEYYSRSGYAARSRRRPMKRSNHNDDQAEGLLRAGIASPSKIHDSRGDYHKEDGNDSEEDDQSNGRSGSWICPNFFRNKNHRQVHHQRHHYADSEQVPYERMKKENNISSETLEMAHLGRSDSKGELAETV